MLKVRNLVCDIQEDMNVSIIESIYEPKRRGKEADNATPNAEIFIGPSLSPNPPKDSDGIVAETYHWVILSQRKLPFTTL